MNYRLRSLTGGAALALALGGLSACNNATEDEPAPATDAPAAEAPTTGGSDAMASGDAPVVGGAPMLPTRNIVQNASEASNLTTLVAAVTAADLGGTLSGAGPFTVFAPTNAAFDKLPKGTVETLTQPAQKQQLSGILTYHVVAGNLTAAEITRQIQAGNGTATLTTVNGAKLTAKAANGGVQLTDAAGGTAMVSQADVTQSNGVVHVIDTVLMPSRG
jgi:uncharacterized surface protein with fasciclin (FAS1) repeats